MTPAEIRQLAEGCHTVRDIDLVNFQGKEYYLLLWSSTNGINDCISRVYDLALKKGLTTRPLKRAIPTGPSPGYIDNTERTAAQMFFNLAAYCGQNGIDLSRALILQHIDNILEEGTKPNEIT